MMVVVEPGSRQGVSKLLNLDSIALLVVALGLPALVAVRWHSYQWDFYMFYGSANDFLHGVTPYRGKGLSFYHPPLTLYFYSLFARLPFLLAYELWFGLKMLALVQLFLLWKRRFLNLEFTWWTTLFFLFAYNGTIYADLVSGNVSLFEQLGLWLGFAALLGGRHALFCLCIVLVAQFKLTPILFALLLLLVPARPQWKWFVVCCAGFVVVFSLNLALQPTLLRDFFSVAPELDERGTLSAGMLALVRDAFDLVGGGEFSGRTRADEVFYLITAFAIGILSLLAIVRHRRTASQPDSKAILYFACVAYAVMIPRMKVYSYILLLIPTLHLLMTLPRRTLVPAAAAALAAVVVFPHANSLFPFRLVSRLFYDYLPLVCGFGVWLGYRVSLQQHESSTALLVSEPPLSA
jgi:glycosyl transferase family 87